MSNAASLALTLLVFLATACSSVKPPKEVVVLARDVEAERLIPGVRVELQSRADGRQPWKHLADGTTNTLGTIGFRLPKHHRAVMRSDSVLRFVIDGADGRHPQRIVPLTGYRALIDLDFRAADTESRGVCVADMHYHISMRAHNRFGQDIYSGARIDPRPGVPPTDVSWHKDLGKLQVRVQGKWRKARGMGWKQLSKAAKDDTDSRRHATYRGLLLGDVRPVKENNRLDHYTQATHPHVREGGVRLAYNAISPFESSLANNRGKRTVSNVVKSGANPRWLNRIGGNGSKEERMTHWENFLLEHDMMHRQDSTIEGLHWRFLRDGRDLESAPDSVLFVVTVIEGGHALQHELFPNEVDMDMANRTKTANEKYMKHLEELHKRNNLDPQSAAALHRLDEEFRQVEESQQLLKDTIGILGLGNIEAQRTLTIQRDSVRNNLFDHADEILEDELARNIRALKALDPPVHMMTVAHLSYNGMLGHAPALDDATFWGRLVARRVYAIRVSEDPQYIKQWKGLFFTVPGVNRFGRRMMKELLDTSNGRRIHIDLKHSDPMARRFFYDSLMTAQAPPICSHCAVNGLPFDYWSPLTDEYAMLRAPFTTHLYPFGINLFDEEIRMFHRHGGIIGLPLEHRVLGGYINKPDYHAFALDRKGRRGGRVCTKRFEHDRRLLLWLRNDSAGRHVLAPAVAYTKGRLGVPERHVDEVLHEDYISVEPLLRNLFHIIDCIRADAPGSSLAHPWQHVCIGSDLDGVIDPIDICPTAGQFPLLRDRMQQFIPVFLHLRRLEAEANRTSGVPAPCVMDDYFDQRFALEDALEAFFHGSLRAFTIKHLRP
ncbi:MAG: hypothetical protein IPM46_02820 [Flavobacteriales bacterium]|nr:hypothetical protein [Flavobacteriales bacterium]